MFNAIKNMFSVQPVAQPVAVPAQQTDVLTMSSREIAELCGKEHAHVMRDIRIMLEELGEAENPDLVSQYQGARRMERCYALPKDLTITLVAGYNVRLRHAIVKRWEQLEQNAITHAPALTQEQMLAQAYVYAIEKGAQQEAVIEEQQEQITALQSLFQEGMTVINLLKQFNGVHVLAAATLLRSKGWVYKDAKNQVRVAAKVRDRYLTEHSYQYTSAGHKTYTNYKPLLLRAGAVKLHEMYIAGELPMKRDWDGKFTHDKLV